MPSLSHREFQSEFAKLLRRPQPPAIEQKVQRIGAHIANVTKWAWERALAHHEAPGEFPLPTDPNSQERAFLAASAALSNGIRRRLGKDSAKLLRSSLAERRAAFGDAADLDPRSGVSAIDQARSRPVPVPLQITQTDLEALAAPPAKEVENRPAGAIRKRLLPRRGEPVPQATGVLPAVSRVKLVAQSIRCVQDSREPGQDEIVLGGFFKTVGFDLTTGELVSPPIFPNRGVLDVRDLGKFKKPETRSLNNLVIESVAVPSSSFPVMPLVFVFLGEKDLFGFGLKMEALSKGFEIKIIAPLIAMFYINAAIGELALIGLFAAASVIIQAAWIVGITIAIAAVLRLLGDELFNAGQMALMIDTPEFRFPNGGTVGALETLTYKRRHAHYELQVRWELEVEP